MGIDDLSKVLKGYTPRRVRVCLHSRAHLGVSSSPSSPQTRRNLGESASFFGETCPPSLPLPAPRNFRGVARGPWLLRSLRRGARVPCWTFAASTVESFESGWESSWEPRCFCRVRTGPTLEPVVFFLFSSDKNLDRAGVLD